ncbi:MAG TPA: crossover junction endodeoxyribonuclease RuvC [Bacteroidetes bacterium]|nr:crossover junction endodeoxyribonuclease RuvC [Bacteroidota bacterium]
MAGNSGPLRVLAIDPGTSTAGYALLDWEAGKAEVLKAGVIRQKPRQALSERLVVLYDRVEELIRTYRPGVLAIEDVFFARNVRSSLKLGEARGVVIVAAARQGLEIAEYSPAEVKQAVAGHGAASKEQIQRMVATLLGLTEVPKPSDVADALAIALCHCHRQNSAATLAGGKG